MSDFRVTESQKAGEVVLGGSLTIENASAIRTKLIATLLREDNIVLCIEADASVDVSFLQILCSAHRTAPKLGKSFTVRYLDPEKFLLTVENAGYTRKRGCARDRGGNCLWVGGGHD
jgi:anti-anti-sigma regulatory factor